MEKNSVDKCSVLILLLAPSRSVALLLLTLFSVDRSDFYKVKTIVVVVVSARHNHFCFVNIRSINRKRVSVAAMQLNGSACEVCDHPPTDQYKNKDDNVLKSGNIHK